MMKFQWQTIRKRILLPMAVLCCAVLSMGVEQCALEEDADWLAPLMEEGDVEPPKAVITIHSIIKYPSGNTSLEQKIQSYSGQAVYV